MPFQHTNVWILHPSASLRDTLCHWVDALGYKASSWDSLDSVLSQRAFGSPALYLLNATIWRQERETLKARFEANNVFLILLCESEADFDEVDVDDYLRVPCVQNEATARLRKGAGVLSMRLRALQIQDELRKREEAFFVKEEAWQEEAESLLAWTAEVYAEQEAERERAQKTQMETLLHAAATLRHEINNPLFAVLGSVEGVVRLLKSRESEPEFQKILLRLERVKLAGERISEVVQAFSKLVEPKTVDYMPGMKMFDLNRGGTSHEEAA